VKVAPVVLQVGPEHPVDDRGLDEQKARQRTPLAQREQDPVCPHHANLVLEHLGQEEDGGEHHDAHAQQVAAADLLKDVERDRGVLVLFGRVPAPERIHRRIGHARERLLAQRDLREQRGEVLERSGHGELRPLGQQLARDPQDPARAAIDRRHRIPQLEQRSPSGSATRTCPTSRAPSDAGPVRPPRPGGT
jgi:hypothetical protein